MSQYECNRVIVSTILSVTYSGFVYMIANSIDFAELKYIYLATVANFIAANLFFYTSLKSLNLSQILFSIMSMLTVILGVALLAFYLVYISAELTGLDNTLKDGAKPTLLSLSLVFLSLCCLHIKRNKSDARNQTRE